MIEKLLHKYPLVSDQLDKTELAVLLRELEAALKRNVPGAVVELGCFEGTASLFIQRLLTQTEQRAFHVYDSFAGLPEKSRQDQSVAGDQFKAGELLASRQKFIRNFRQAGLVLPVIHKCWFADLAADDMPGEIAFAFLDGDFYASIKDSLHVIAPHLAPGATVVVDDYQSEALPGAAKAVNEWLAARPHRIRTEASLAIIYL